MVATRPAKSDFQTVLILLACAINWLCSYYENQRNRRCPNLCCCCTSCTANSINRSRNLSNLNNNLRNNVPRPQSSEPRELCDKENKSEMVCITIHPRPTRPTRPDFNEPPAAAPLVLPALAALAVQPASLIPKSLVHSLFSYHNDRTEYYTKVWREFSIRHHFFGILPVGQITVEYLGCLLCCDKLYLEYHKTVIPEAKLCYSYTGQIITRHLRDHASISELPAEMGAILLRGQELCQYCGLSIGHHYRNRESIPDLQFENEGVPDWFFNTRRYYCEYKCPLYSCRTCQKPFVKAEEYQDSCSSCIVAVRSRPVYSAMRWHRFLNAYTDELELLAKSKKLIVHKTSYKCVRAAKGGGFKTISLKSVDMPATEANIRKYLATVQFKCQGFCGLVWNVPPFQTSISEPPDRPDRPDRPAYCGFCVNNSGPIILRQNPPESLQILQVLQEPNLDVKNSS